MTITRIRRLFTVAALALGLAGASAVTTSPAPASASLGIEICIEWNGELICVWVPHAIDWKYVLCPGCPPELSLKDDYVINPELEAVVAGEVAQGVGDLLAARVLGVSGARTSGLAHLQRAAQLADRGISTDDPEPTPWANAVQQDLAEGLDLLQRAANTRNAAVARRLHTQAVGEIDKAINRLDDMVTAV